MLGPHTPKHELDQLHEAGVRAARINWQVPPSAHDCASTHSTLGQAALALHKRLGERTWAIEVFARLPVLLAAASTFAALDRPVIIDHFGMPGLHSRQKDFCALLAMLEANPQLMIKLSAPYQVSRKGPDYGDLQPLVQELGRAVPAQLLWGSNWPHTSGILRNAPATNDRGVEPFRYENDARTLDQLTRYLDDSSAATAMLCRNPARVFNYC